MQLHPQESFTLVRQLNNPYITDTFYVRAVIRNAKTDAIIDTINLTDNTGQRFSKTWQVPADVSGQGFFISIVTSVYTDAGYTTKSENYGDEETTYLVQERYIFNPNYPVGADVDYKRIKKIVKEVVDARIEEIVVEPKIVTVTKEVVKDIQFPEQEKVNLTPVLNLLDGIKKTVQGIKIPEPETPEKVNLTPISESLFELKEELHSIKSVVSEDTIFKKVEELRSALEKVKDLVTPVPVITPYSDMRVSKILKKEIKSDNRVAKLLKR